MKISTVGLDLAKNVFQVHGVDVGGGVVVRRALRRRQVMPFFRKLDPCLIGMEACGTSHHWARELIGLGHEVKLMPPAYVKPYVKRGKTDAADAEAICEAVTRPTMRFVAVKSTEQQAILALHRTRDLLIRQRTQLVNMIRAQLAEFGIVMARGIGHVLELVGRLLDGEVPDIPPLAVKVVIALARQLRDLQARIGSLEKDLVKWSRGNPMAKRLETIPGIGVITASALAATVTDPRQFTSGRQFAAWLGLTPRANCSGGKERLGHISKMGDRYLRRLLVSGMMSRLRWLRLRPDSQPWAAGLLRRKPAKLVAVAMAKRPRHERLTAPRRSRLARTMRGDGKPVEHRGWGQPDRCPGRTSPLSRMGPHPKQTIRASGSRHRANRPDTRLNPTTLHQRQINPCNQGAIHTGH